MTSSRIYFVAAGKTNTRSVLMIAQAKVAVEIHALIQNDRCRRVDMEQKAKMAYAVLKKHCNSHDRY